MKNGTTSDQLVTGVLVADRLFGLPFRFSVLTLLGRAVALALAACRFGHIVLKTTPSLVAGHGNSREAYPTFPLSR